MDVAVIGAGIAGLAAARNLEDSGAVVRVFEHRDRVGGRLLSYATGSAGRLDLGATWFWPGEHRVADLVAELGIATHDHHLAGDAMFHEPSGSLRLDGNPIDTPSARFSDGADSITSALAARLDPQTVLLGNPVRSIDVDSTGATVRHRNGQTTAKHVILALPPALAVTTIDIRPAVPERLKGLAAVTPVWMGAMSKAVAVYESAFWREQGLSGSAISHVGPLREVHDMSGPDGDPPALFGFAPATTGPGPDEAAIIHQLTEIFGPSAANPVEVVVKDWLSEPATSPPGAERLQAFQTFGHPSYQEPFHDGRLHWASTETAIVAPGHIEGALAAAERAATAIQTSLGIDPRNDLRPPAQATDAKS